MHELLADILPPERRLEMLAIGKEKRIAEGEYFLRAGEVPNRLAYASSGLFRYVYINEKGDEFTKGLIDQKNFITSYSSMIKQEPSYYFIEALEDSVLLEIQYKDWLALLDSHPFWTSFLLKLVEFGYMQKEKRERELLLLDAETRYRNFLTDYANLNGRIPQTIIASFLGIKPETLSRIKKKLGT